MNERPTAPPLLESAERITLKVAQREWRIIPTRDNRPIGLQFGDGCFIDGTNVYITPEADQEDVGWAVSDLVDCAVRAVSEPEPE